MSSDISCRYLQSFTRLHFLLIQVNVWPNQKEARWESTRSPTLTKHSTLSPAKEWSWCRLEPKVSGVASRSVSDISAIIWRSGVFHEATWPSLNLLYLRLSHIDFSSFLLCKMGSLVLPLVTMAMPLAAVQLNDILIPECCGSTGCALQCIFLRVERRISKTPRGCPSSSHRRG